LASCGTKESTNSVGIYDLQTAMLAADDSLPQMQTVNSSSEDAARLFAYLSDMDYEKVNSFFLAYCQDGKEADEIAVIELKDQADLQEAQDSVQDHVDGRIKLYSTYGPDQAQRAEKALIFQEGNYVVLIISDQQDKVKEAFEAQINN
jgi:hypothetical protein